MAKVKFQLFNCAEYLYTDAAGIVHNICQTIKYIFTPAYPKKAGTEAKVVRKSPHVKKPATRGKGSKAKPSIRRRRDPKHGKDSQPGKINQSGQRECYQQCADRWNEMPDVDPDCGTCPQTTSKAHVWAAKLEQGVMCSYFDLYMACCLSFCVMICITGPDGIEVCGGTIPPDDNCWPIVSPCKDSELSIAYTTQQMCFNGSQALQAYDSVLGLDICCCPTGDFSWEIVSGDGMLEPDSGPSTVYTAPDNNTYCTGNPKIRVTDCCGRTAEVTLAVSNCSLQQAAITCCTQLIGTLHINCRNIQMCDGSWLWSDFLPEECGACEYGGHGIAQSCEFAGYPPIDDLRTPEMIAAGCCPSLLL